MWHEKGMHDTGKSEHRNVNKTVKRVCTSNRYWRVGTSIPQISDTLVNCAFVWFFRNDSTGSTPSGCIRTSSSLPCVTWTCCTYLGIHCPTYSPKSPSVFFITGFSGLIIADKTHHTAHCTVHHDNRSRIYFNICFSSATRTLTTQIRLSVRIEINNSFNTWTNNYDVPVHTQCIP